MRPEDQLLIACTRQDFQNRHQAEVLRLHGAGAIDWGYVAETAAAHNVAPIVYTNLARCTDDGLAIPAETWGKLQELTFRNVALMSGVAVKLAEGLAFLRARSIDALLLKGAALAVLVYAQPWYTVHDIDLVLRCRQADLATAEAAEIGHFFHRIPGVEYDYFEHHDVTMNGMLPVDFRRIWQDAQQIDYRGQTAWVMAPEDLLISICINSCRKRFFRLKALFDIAETLRTCQEMNWATLYAKTAHYQVSAIVYAALFAAESTLGCNLPQGALQGLQVSRTRTAAIKTLVRRFCERQSFGDLYSGRQAAGRWFNNSLLLPYVTYRGRQGARKLAFLLSSPPRSAA